MYDYIIVGAGSAGCVIANKLTENPDVSVCLIESGPENRSKLISTPLGIGGLMWHPKLNWRFFTLPEPHLNNRRLYCPQGRVLGGSSSINAMVYMRGQPNDFDLWASLGNKGWSYEELKPYFDAQEWWTDEERTAPKDSRVRISKPRYINRLTKVFLESSKDVGLPVYEQLLNQECFGSGVYALSQVEGRRCSSADAFLTPVAQRSNLRIITGATVCKILLSGDRAVGVRYRKGNNLLEVRCHEELILSAGAIGSPYLLLLSGIGPEDELLAKSIEVNHSLPGVGKNLQDHLDVTVTHKCNTQDTFGLSWPFLLKFMGEIKKYHQSKTGMLCSNVAEAGAFTYSSPSSPFPDLQFHFTPAFLRKHGFSLDALGHHYSLRVCLLYPKSRGEITLNTENVYRGPDIRFNYLAEEEDLTKLLSGLKQAREILNSAAFSKFRVDEVYPGVDIQSESAMKEFIRRNAETIYHPVGTCKMGKDPMAVVDPKLRLHGMSNVRVADASVMPTIIGGNTNATAMVIGAKAADLILENSLS
ncbi:MAG TPA: GMC family oxidoreductase [Gammaproteobacteria bacterium]|nr:GMC family oxidoreductase [Gammaproteobacteria bacterium]